MDEHYALLLDDEYLTGKALQDILKRYGIEALYVASPSEAMKLFLAQDFCLVIMDTHLKDANGIEVLKFMKDIKTTPVLVLSHMREEEVVHILLTGADACLAKPIDAELCAAQALSLVRLHEVARNPERYEKPFVLGADVTIKPDSRQAVIEGKALHLTNLEFDVLYYLANHRHMVIQYSQIYRQVWGPGPASMDAVRACIKELRKKILATKTQKIAIRNVRGIGYQFVYKESDF